MKTILNFLLVSLVAIALFSCEDETNEVLPSNPVVDEITLNDFDGRWTYESVEFDNNVFTDCKPSELFDLFDNENTINLKMTGLNINFNSSNSTARFIDCDSLQSFSGDFVRIDFDDDTFEFTAFDKSDEESVKFQIVDSDLDATTKKIKVEIVTDFKGELIGGTNVVEGLVFTLVKN